jgi:hypothetical protein
MQAPRARGSARTVRFVRCAHVPPARFRWAPVVAAGLLFTLVALKAMRPDDEQDGPGHRRSIMTLCSDPWLLPNMLMALGETAAAVALCARSWRPIGAGLGLLTMSSAALFSAYAGLARVDLSGCGCFGPFDAPWWVHLAVASAVAVPCAFALPDAPRPSSARRCEVADRATRSQRLPSAR